MSNPTTEAHTFVLAMAATFMGCLKEVLTLLASSADISDANDATQSAARGGALNYRTGKFDDGTDATGWYEKD